MIYSPIWKDNILETTSTTLNYRIRDLEAVRFIENNYTKAMPGQTGVTLCINNKVDGYLNPDFEHLNFPSITDAVTKNPNAVKTFRVLNPSENDLGTYKFLYDWSYEDNWSGQTGHNMSEPIRHIDPRMKAMFTIYDSAETNYAYSIEYNAYVWIKPSTLTFNVLGGEQNVKVYSKGNWVANVNNNWITIDIDSHLGTPTDDDITVVTVTVDENLTGSERSGSITFTGEDNEVVLNISQNEAILSITPETYTFDRDGNGSVTFTIMHTYDIATSFENVITFDDGLWFTMSQPIITDYGAYKRTEITCTANGSCIGINNYAEFVVTDEMNNTVRAELRQEKYYPNGNEILYKTTDGTIFEYPGWVSTTRSGSGRYTWYRTYLGESLGPDARVTSNTYINGVGRLEFNDIITTVRGLFHRSLPAGMSSEGRIYADRTNNLNDKLLLLVLPSSATYTGQVCCGQTHLKSAAFYGEIDTPNGTIFIGGDFSGCNSLLFADLPEALRLSATFSGCESLREVNIPKVEYLRGGVFNNCYSLEGTVPINNIKELTSDATFNNCYKLFNDNVNFSSLELYQAMDAKFSNCRFKNLSLNDNAVVYNGGFDGLQSTRSLTGVTIPSSTTIIRFGAFEGSGIKSINLPSGVTKISKYAFRGCNELESITINSQVHIEEFAFDCDKLKTINYNCLDRPILDKYALGGLPNNGTIHIPYNATYGISVFNDGAFSLSSKGWTLVKDL